VCFLPVDIQVSVSVVATLTISIVVSMMVLFRWNILDEMSLRRNSLLAACHVHGDAAAIQNSDFPPNHAVANVVEISYR
jgi:hypothetical protein